MSVWLNVKRVIELTRPLRDIGWSLQCIRKFSILSDPMMNEIESIRMIVLNGEFVLKKSNHLPGIVFSTQ